MERILAAIPGAVDEIRGKPLDKLGMTILIGLSESRRQGGKDGRAASDV
jgi:hypothetical protein